MFITNTRFSPTYLSPAPCLYYKVWSRLPYWEWFYHQYNFKGKKILDVGSGIESPVWKKCMREGGTYYCWDIDPKVKEWAGEKHDVGGHIGSFDYVISTQVYEHINPEDRRKFILEWRDYLKPHGVMVINYPLAYNLDGLVGYYQLIDHRRPPVLADEVLLNINPDKYFNEVRFYLVGMPRWNILKVIFNLMMNYLPFNQAHIEAVKR